MYRCKNIVVVVVPFHIGCKQVASMKDNGEWVFEKGIAMIRHFQDKIQFDKISTRKIWQNVFNVKCLTGARSFFVFVSLVYFT